MTARTLQLRTRLAIAGAVLIALTLGIGVWSAVRFRAVSRVVGTTIANDEGTTNATSKLAESIEREDDAVLLVLSDRARGISELGVRRRAVADALHALVAELEAPDETPISRRVTLDLAAYDAAVDRFVANADDPRARERYHEDVNPVLRRAVETIHTVREQHFLSSQAVAAWARDRATSSMAIVVAISAVALALLVVIVLHLARVVMAPIGEMTRAVEAMRAGDFSRRVAVVRDDELGRLGVAYNGMADELEAFRSANIGAVIVAKETLEAMLEAFPDAVIVFDPEERVSACNAQALAILGRRPLSELPPKVRRLVEVALTEGAPNARVELANAVELRVDDRPRKFLPRVAPIGRMRGAVLVLSDVTELVRLDDLRLELVAVASHELRTPLTTMRMSLAMMKERAEHLAPHDRDLVATAAIGVEQLAVLVDEFLNLTQIEAGLLVLHWSRVDLRELVAHCTHAVAPSCDGAGLALATDFGDALPASIAGDRARLAMVLTNLLANAIKYSPPGGRIDVRVRSASSIDRVAIEVIDAGPGIPVEYRERVFERFFRVEHDRGDHGVASGAGIGLYVARQVAEAHRGTIACTDNVAGGARFLLTLPVEREDSYKGLPHH